MGLESLMIPRFFKIVGDDINYIINNYSNRNGTQKQQVEFSLVAMRLSGAALMGVGAICTISALPIASALGALALATTVATYIIGHDFFKMSTNAQAIFNLDTASLNWKDYAKFVEACLKRLQNRSEETPEEMLHKATRQWVIDNTERDTILPWKYVLNSIIPDSAITQVTSTVRS